MEREIIEHILAITLGYFAIGALAILWITRGKDSEFKKRQWIKYFVYLFIVHFIVFLILLYPGMFFYLALLIVATGFYELINVSRDGNLSWQILFSFILYLLLAAGFVLFAGQSSAETLLLTYLIVFVFDGFSQITGQLLGRHKLSQVISPNKTIEGFIGGVSMAVITTLMSGMNFRRGFAIALLISLASLGGDLTASYFKRINRVKDYSNLIPGNGGVLDRFDSFIAAGCIVYLMFDLMHIV